MYRGRSDGEAYNDNDNDVEIHTRQTTVGDDEEETTVSDEEYEKLHTRRKLEITRNNKLNVSFSRCRRLPPQVSLH